MRARRSDRLATAIPVFRTTTSEVAAESLAGPAALSRYATAARHPRRPRQRRQVVQQDRTLRQTPRWYVQRNGGPQPTPQSARLRRREAPPHRTRQPVGVPDHRRAQGLIVCPRPAAPPIRRIPCRRASILGRRGARTCRGRPLALSATHLTQRRPPCQQPPDAMRARSSNRAARCAPGASRSRQPVRSPAAGWSVAATGRARMGETALTFPWERRPRDMRIIKTLILACAGAALLWPQAAELRAVLLLGTG